jgi:hypothetical protein
MSNAKIIKGPKRFIAMQRGSIVFYKVDNDEIGR